MALWKVARTYRSILRLKEIVTVGARYGFTEVFEHITKSGLIPHFRVSVDADAESLSAPERARRALQELGPTFVKFGQVLATRPDIIPEAWANEFARLQDDVDSFPADDARRLIEEELGRPLEEAFDEFVPEPAGSGSIAQTHFATLKGGEKVVIKVRRPDISKTIRADLDIIAKLAELAEKHVDELRIYRPTMLVDEFRRNLERELDFLAEASSMHRLREELADDPRIRIPKVYWDYTTGKILTAECMMGTPLTDLDRVLESGVDAPALAVTIAECFMRQFFEVGLFHADPHPGNIFIEPDGAVALLDFGSTGSLSREIKRQLITTMVALDQGDLDLIIDINSEAGIFADTEDISKLRGDLSDLIGSYYGVPANRIDMGALFGDVVRTARNNRVALPREFVLLGRSLVLVVGLCQKLSADFNLAEVIKPHVRKMLVSGLSPKNLAKRGVLEIYMLAGFFRRLPREISQLLRKARQGELEITLRHEEMTQLANEIEVASNRISFSVVTAAIVVGSSLLLHANVPPKVSLFTDLLGLGKLGDWQDLSIFGLAGFVIASLFGLKLLWDITRSGRLGR